MVKRLVELYEIGEAVEVRFRDGRWQPCRVIRHDHPGVWVVTAEGRQWFVTSSRHIRKAAGK